MVAKWVVEQDQIGGFAGHVAAACGPWPRRCRPPSGRGRRSPRRRSSRRRGRATAGRERSGASHPARRAQTRLRRRRPGGMPARRRRSGNESAFTVTPSGPNNPTSRATAVAVPRWSPVIIATLMPAPRQAVIASGTSSRGGSSNATRPSRRNSLVTLRQTRGRATVPRARGNGEYPQPTCGGEATSTVNRGLRLSSTAERKDGVRCPLHHDFVGLVPRPCGVSRGSKGNRSSA